MLRRHLNFRQISHRFTSSFANPSFQDLNGSHIMYWNMTILNPSRFKVEPHSKYWYFCFERWDLLSLRFSENAVLLFHIEWLCLKTSENVYRPLYRYIALTHWACPASSANSQRRPVEPNSIMATATYATVAYSARGALPYVGGYQVPVNRPLFFTPILHPMTPFFYSVHTQWPPFFHFCIKFYIKSANLCALRAHFEKLNDFVAILKENLQILPWNCIFAHWMTPIFGSPHQKSPHFFGAHTEWSPSFDEILHWMPPIFVLR